MPARTAAPSSPSPDKSARTARARHRHFVNGAVLWYGAAPPSRAQDAPRASPPAESLKFQGDVPIALARPAGPFEPAKTGQNERDMALCFDQSPIVLRRLDDVRTRAIATLFRTAGHPSDDGTPVSGRKESLLERQSTLPEKTSIKRVCQCLVP